MIAKLATDFPVQALCRVLQVSRSGYYRWGRRSPSPRAQANAQLLGHIEQAFEQSRQSYGSPRITRQLHRYQVACGHNRVARLMRAHHIRPKCKRPFRPRTTQSQPGLAPAPNRLKEQGPPSRPNQVWTADITYLWTLSGWVYLATTMDLCSRKIVGWTMAACMEASLVKEALQQALAVRRPAAGLLHHSDRGSQYTSSAFQALLHSHHLLPSMSAAGHCYDNAAMESFWSTLKGELIQNRVFRDLDEAKLAVFDYIETFYNRQRLHSALDFKSPVEFEQQLAYEKS